MLTIRTAQITDLARLVELDIQSFAESLPPFVLRQFLDLAGDFALVGELDGAVVGYTLGTRGPAPDVAWLLSAAVSKDVREKGVGTKLGEELERRLVAAGMKKFLLSVRPDNTPMINWCRRTGYQQISDDPNYFGPGERRLVMCKMVKP